MHHIQTLQRTYYISPQCDEHIRLKEHLTDDKGWHEAVKNQSIICEPHHLQTQHNYSQTIGQFTQRGLFHKINSIICKLTPQPQSLLSGACFMKII